MSIEALHTRGFAVIRGFMPPAEVRALSQSFDHLLEIARTDADPGSAQFVVDRDPFRLHRVVWCGGADPRLAALGSDPRYLRLAAEALGSTELVQLIQQAHYKLPGDGVAFNWHQDASNRRYGSELWSDINGRGSFVQMALAIDPMRPDNGPLQMIPGSQRLGFVADPHTGQIPAELIDLDQAVTVELEPGDLALFGPFTLHHSAPNRSSIPRRLFLQGYALPGANHREYPGCGLGVTRHLPPQDP